MKYTFDVLFYNGTGLGDKSPKLDIILNIPFVTGNVTKTITLHGDNIPYPFEFITQHNVGVILHIKYDNASGFLVIEGELPFATDTVDLNMNISSPTLPRDVDINITMYNIVIYGKTYITSEDKYIKVSTAFAQIPLSNTVQCYNFTNSPFSTYEVTNSANVITSSSSTGVMHNQSSTGYSYRGTYTYFDSATNTYITVSDVGTGNINVNVYYPIVTSAFTNDGVLIDDKPVPNTKFTGIIQADYTQINLTPQSGFITDFVMAKLNIAKTNGVDVRHEVINHNLVYAQSFIDYSFKVITGLDKGDYIAKLSYSVVDNIVPSHLTNDKFIVGNYYQPVVKAACRDIHNGGNTIHIDVNTPFYIDPAIFGVIGTELTFTGIDNMFTVLLYTEGTFRYNVPYKITSGNVTIDTVTYGVGEYVYIKPEDTVTNFTATLLLVTEKVIYVKNYNIETNNNFEITRNECNKYILSNTALNTISVTIEEVVYNVDDNLSAVEHSTFNISSGDTYVFTPNNDSVYYVTVNSNGIITKYTLVTLCNTETCMLNYINDLLCCNNDTNCECNLQTVDCQYIDRSNFIAVSLLYDLLKDKLNATIGFDTLYTTDTLSEEDVYLISELLARIYNFCKSC